MRIRRPTAKPTADMTGSALVALAAADVVAPAEVEMEEKPNPSMFLSTSDESNEKKKKVVKAVDKKRKRAINRHRLTADELSSLLSLVGTVAADARRFLSANDLLIRPRQAMALESALHSVAFSLAGLHSTLPDGPLHSFLSPSATDNWFQRFISGSVTGDDVWIDYFGLPRSAFEALAEDLSPSIDGDGPAVSVAVAAALFRLAHAAPYKAVARRFGFEGAGAACRAFYGVIKAVLCRLSNLLPGVPAEKSRIVEGFGRVSLPNCCGALGFRRFPAGKGSVVAQGLVDSEGRFLDVSAGWPASTAPSSVLRLSDLYLRLDGESSPLGDEPSEYVIGGSCYPLLRWLIVPFTEADVPEKTLFNSLHEKGLGLVGAAFIRVENRWRLLASEWKEGSLQMLPTVLMACCLLHNFAHKYRVVMPCPSGEAQKEEDAFEKYAGKDSEEGDRVRAAILASILSSREDK